LAGSVSSLAEARLFSNLNSKASLAFMRDYPKTDGVGLLGGRRATARRDAAAGRVTAFQSPIKFLGEGPSGHCLRRGEISPFVSKFLR
jgi:hypothetical protein